MKIELYQVKKGPDLPDRQSPGVYQSTDTQKIDALLVVVRSARETEDHKCSSSGKITLVLKDEGEVKIGFLPGHHPESYEIRVYPEEGDNSPSEGKKQQIRDLSSGEGCIPPGNEGSRVENPD